MKEIEIERWPGGVTSEQPCASIETVDREIPYGEFFARFLSANRPCLFADFLTEPWSSRTDWLAEGREPNVDFFVRLLGESAAVPVSDCGKRFFNAQEKCERTLGEYVEYWKARRAVAADSRRDGARERNDECLYLKDWHFVRSCPESYRAYTCPVYFSSDWLNEWWDNRTDEDEQSDYKFVYIGPKGGKSLWSSF